MWFAICFTACNYACAPGLECCIFAAALTTHGSKNTLLHMAARGGHASMVRRALPSRVMMQRLQRQPAVILLLVSVTFCAGRSVDRDEGRRASRQQRVRISIAFKVCGVDVLCRLKLCIAAA
jgi:hypothetical protein